MRRVRRPHQLPPLARVLADGLPAGQTQTHALLEVLRKLTMQLRGAAVGVVAGKDQRARAVLDQTIGAAPHEPKYAYTVAFDERQQGHLAEALRLLHELVDRQPAFPDAFEFLGRIDEDQGNRVAAHEIYQKAATNPALTDQRRAHVAQRAVALDSRRR